MKISNLLERKGTDVLTTTPECTVQDAIKKLCAHRIGALVVVGENEELLGIVTERDVLMDCGFECSQLKKLAEPDCPACPRRVEDVMTRDVVIGLPGDTIEYVMGIMTQNRVRHLPVLDDGTLVGIVSIGDVVNAHLSQTTFENRFLKDYINGPTASIETS